jgi:hypothetical protein
MKTCIFVLLSISCLAARDEDLTYTNGLANGRMWKAMGTIEKATYLDGYRAGVLKAALMIPDDSLSKATVQVLAGFNLTNGEISLAIVRFYKDPLNLRIAISDAVAVAVQEASGASPQEVDQSIRNLRREIAQKEAKDKR